MKYINKVLFVVLLTLITMIVLKTNTDLKPIFYKYVYEDNIKFASINNLYKKYFGSIIPNDNLKKVSNESLVYQKKEKYKDGVKLTVSKNYAVPAIKEGMVVFVGEKEGYGKTVIISGIDGIDIWYSNIESSVKIYDYVDKSEIIGEANDSLYIVIKKKDNVLDYEKYI